MTARWRVSELAAFLGMTEDGIWSIIHRRHIQPIGKDGRANLYDPLEMIRHAGAHDRRLVGTDKPDVQE